MGPGPHAFSGAADPYFLDKMVRQPPTLIWCIKPYKLRKAYPLPTEVVLYNVILLPRSYICLWVTVKNDYIYMLQVMKPVCLPIFEQSSELICN